MLIKESSDILILLIDNNNKTNTNDSTNITFISLGALVVTLRQGLFKIKEEGFLESVLTGSDPDPYVVISVLENEISEPIKETFRSRIMKVFGNREGGMKLPRQNSFMRVLDSAKSDRKVRSFLR